MTSSAIETSEPLAAALTVISRTSCWPGSISRTLRGVVEEQRPHAEGVVQLGARRRPARIDIAHPRRTDDPHGIGPAVMQYAKTCSGEQLNRRRTAIVSAPAVAPRDPHWGPNLLSPPHGRRAASPPPS